MHIAKKLTALASFLLLTLILFFPASADASSLAQRDDKPILNQDHVVRPVGTECIGAKGQQCDKPILNQDYIVRPIGKECIGAKGQQCLPDLTISYEYDDECNMAITITNVGDATATTGINLVGVNGTSVIGGGSIILGPDQQHTIFMPAYVVNNLQIERLGVDPNNDVEESNEENNFVDVAPCRVCNATVDPYLDSYSNGALKASVCLKVIVDGSTANLSGYGQNKGISGIGTAPADTETRVNCQIKQNGNEIENGSGEDYGTWNFQIDFNQTISHQPGDSYEMSCEHEWDVPSEDFYLMSSPQAAVITP